MFVFSFSFRLFYISFSLFRVSLQFWLIFSFLIVFLSPSVGFAHWTMGDESSGGDPGGPGGGREGEENALQDSIVGIEVDEENDEPEVIVDEDPEVLKRTAFLSLREYGLLKDRTDDIAYAIWNENKDKTRPVCAFRKSGAFKLIYETEEQRDKAIVEKLHVLSIVVNLEKPRVRPDTRRIVLRMHQIPFSISNEEVGEWMKVKFPMVERTSAVRRDTYGNTGIQNNVRSAVIEMPKEYAFPGFHWMQTRSMKKPVRVELSHWGMTPHCRKCTVPGHIARDCPGRAAVRAAATPSGVGGSYAEALSPRRSRGGPRGGAPVLPAATRPSISEVVPNPLVNLGEPASSVPLAEPEPAASSAPLVGSEPTENRRALRSQSIPRRTEKVGQQEQPVVHGFFTKNSFLSNHFPVVIVDDEKEFGSTEHVLYYHKALHCGEPGKAEEIRMAQTAADAKKIGKKIKWDEETLGSWRIFAHKILHRANENKFKLHAELRAKLFRTKGKILAEMNPHGDHWGTGIPGNHPDAQQPSKWPGKNAFGELLMELRESLMSHPDYADEVGNRSRSASRKRRRMD